MLTRSQPSILETEPLGDLDENLFEETTVQRLENLGYRSVDGRELRDDDTFPETDVVHRPTLRQFFRKQYPFLDQTALNQAVQRVANPDGVDLLQRNKNAHHLITKGFELAYEAEDGTEAIPSTGSTRRTETSSGWSNSFPSTGTTTGAQT
jgi:type I site-specific restriction-modification system R (restriction) subunit